MRNLINTTIDHKFKGKKLKDFLRFDLDLSSRMLKNLAKHDQIFINRKIVRLNYLVKGGEKLTINLDKDETMDIKPVCMPLTIVYEDDSLIVVDKPPYLVVHPTKRHQEDTLTNGLL
jgi:23S rRNA pseudouridine1911/1915/1917 synthase